MSFNIKVHPVPHICLSLFPRFLHGEHFSPFEIAETLGVPPVSLLPQLVVTETCGSCVDLGEEQ